MSTTTADDTMATADPAVDTTSSTTTTSVPPPEPSSSSSSSSHPPPKAPVPRPPSEWTILTTPQDHSFLPTLGVTLWLGWNGFLVYLGIYLIFLAGPIFRTVAAGVLVLSLLLPRDVGNWREVDDRKEEEDGMETTERMGLGRRFGYWCMRMGERYFGLTTILEDEPSLDRIARDPARKAAVFALEPHDILPYPVFAFSPALGRLPGRVGRDHSCLMTSAIFCVPLLRQVYTWVSANPIERTTFRRRLERGESFSFVPGGVREVSSLGCDPASNPRGDPVLYLKKRKGFVKLALASGSPVVPVFCFGVEGSYGYWIPRGEFASRVGRTIGFLPMLFWGRFGVPFGIPYPRRITVAVGSPIEFPQLGEDKMTDAAISEYHALFLGEMEALYERHKANAGYGDRRLRII